MKSMMYIWDGGKFLSEGHKKKWTGMQPNAKFTLHDFSPIFHSLTGFDKSPTNARHRRQIDARSHERQSCSMNYQRCDLRSSSMCRRHLQNIWHAKHLELSAIHNPAVWMSSDWKIHQWWPTANERARHRAAGSSGRTFFIYLFYYKAIYKQRAYILALEYTAQVG